MKICGYRIKEIVQARPTIYQVLKWKIMKVFKVGRDEFSAKTG